MFDYTEEELKNILKKIETIAIIGASINPTRDSFKVMKYMIKCGYKVFPVNPNEVDNKVFGLKFFSELDSIQERIDMVDIFRSKDHVREITRNAIKNNVKVIWTQEGGVDEESAMLARKSGITFVMNKCPKKVLDN